jgi:hypothetical protein
MGLTEIDNLISYHVQKNKVEQKPYFAVALSPSKIKSNYKGGFISKTSAIVEFKFSINGFDNERKPDDENHYIHIQPENNEYVTPVYVFGKALNDEKSLQSYSEEFLPINSSITVKFRIDFNNVLKSFSEKGFYITPTGDKIFENEFEGLFIAGNTEPLSWNFGEIQKNEKYQLTDPDNDGIYECDIVFKTNDYRSIDKEGFAVWNLKKDISKYPKYSAVSFLQESIYNMSLEELLYDIREDSTFMAGAKWHGVWTRDISYSIYLSLALIEPEIAKKSLLVKVDRDRIIQDTGTGGSWPISTDRVVWAAAAWEVYLATGDKDWLKRIYTILKNTIDADYINAFDTETGLIYGESSFLDWREQSYPKWMDPKDIYVSKCLGTNALHYRALVIMSEICSELGLDTSEYSTRAEALKNAINNYLWNEETCYYGQYLYGRLFDVLSPKSETLGESLSIIFEIADKNKSESIIKNMPVVEYGPTCFFPQIPGVPSYHNNAIWPFVSSYYTWAAAKTGNSKAVDFGVNSIIRAASLFLTNKENMVATTGHFDGTEINSNRMLWSIAGNLAITYRVFFGINLTAEGIIFTPTIPVKHSGKHTLDNFKYHDANIKVIVNGSGNKITKALINGEEVDEVFIKTDAMGDYLVEIYLEDEGSSSEINLVENKFSPETPNIVMEEDVLTWEEIPSVKEYKIIVNGKNYSTQTTNRFKIGDNKKIAEVSVVAVDSSGYESFMSKPIVISDDLQNLIKPDNGNTLTEIKGYIGSGYIQTTQLANNNITFDIEVADNGIYAVDFRYANGNGPINTDNACAIRTLYLDDKFTAPVVLPQRGDKVWDDWGYSNSVLIKIDKGNHKLSLRYDPINMNMNVTKNEALIDAMRIIQLK